MASKKNQTKNALHWLRHKMLWQSPHVSDLKRNYVEFTSTPLKTSISPENWWLEDEISFRDGLFSGVMLVSGRAHVLFVTLVEDLLLSFESYQNHTPNHGWSFFPFTVKILLNMFEAFGSLLTRRFVMVETNMAFKFCQEHGFCANRNRCNQKMIIVALDLGKTT